MLKQYIESASGYLPFWDILSEDDKYFINKTSKLLKGIKGELLHGGSNNCTGVLIVLGGSLRCFILSEEGKEITLYRLFKGDVCVFSASCILKNINFDIYIASENNYEAVVLNSKTYDNIKQKYNEAEVFTNEIIAERFSDVMWTIEKILFLSFDKRLAIFLLDQTALTGSNIINLTHEEIAKNIGSAREVVSRMLKYFADEGFVSLSRGNITVINKEKLRKIYSDQT